MFSLGALFMAAGNRSLVIKVTDKESGRPVAYAQVRLKDAGYGMLASENGVVVVGGRLSDGDSVKISCVGYQPEVMIVDNSFLRGDTVTVEMTQKAFEYPEVEVRPPRKVKKRRIGKRHDSGLFHAFADPLDGQGSSVAWEVGNGKNRMWLTGWGFQIIPDTICDTHDGVVTTIYPLSEFHFRINVYDATRAESPTYEILTKVDNIQSESVIVHYSLDMVKDNNFVYQFPEPILLPAKAVVEIEFLEDFPENERIYFKSNMFGKAFLSRLRHKYEDTWLRLNVAMPYYVLLQEDFF